MTKHHARRPRLGFLGTGWIGRHRMEAIHRSGEAEITAIADRSPENARQAAKIAPEAILVDSLDDLLSMKKLDGIVIATPSACHSSQAIQALDAGFSVFCQKPLARTAEETGQVIDAARKADRLLSVDFSYRYTDGFQKINSLAKSGGLGDIYAADLVFHNAYGPDKPWFYDAALSGGGCLMDLGIHLIDLALWVLDFPRLKAVSSSIYAGGTRLNGPGMVEDYAVASLGLENGSIVRIACSWNLPAGQDAVIESTFFGTKGGARFSNINGSFYDFTAERFTGTSRETLSVPPEDWGGRASVAWVQQLRNGGGFSPATENLLFTAAALDAAYGR
ncbi:NAD(P)-dependent oxidoreductase [Geotalea daltonii FRC-32]|uniref:NAD(P)-dependent oxidoreductase n=1 Tax=Geotalea daltonii (strain DSM 22248 / JCM 15807 / FRC-32) TaxID=316067 RepID=B9M4D1_GEODF|nr:Gfo/Idh/MocA family oxidoreductase [Geotalea daltonii]ACM21586.1 NAD(P)-dependent oxidoreductase [Geotalea daltonii FRC-32]